LAFDFADYSSLTKHSTLSSFHPDYGTYRGMAERNDENDIYLHFDENGLNMRSMFMMIINSQLVEGIIN
jgi:hypothetical protein